MMPPETWAMPLVITVISSERVSSGRNGGMVSGASVWPMKILGAAGAHEAGHHLSGEFDDELHDSVVIEHGEEGGDKNDGRQHLECKKESHRRALRTERTEDELRSLKGIAKQAIDGVSRLLEK